MVVTVVPATHGAGIGNFNRGIVGCIPAIVRGITSRAGKAAATAAAAARDLALQEAPKLIEQGKKAALGALQSKAKDLTAKALACVSEHATAGLPPAKNRQLLLPFEHEHTNS